MLLQTNLKHIATEDDFNKIINENENVMICCGRMGPMCLPVYDVMEEFENSGDYNHVGFRDMLFDNPDAHVIRNLPECSGFMGLPFTVYFKNGKVVKATSSIQSAEQVKEILDTEFK
ncbi:MAG: thioredoxin [Chlorobi bacterium]|nr:thioredoxin [Chlorobiota bacterium]